MGYTTVNEAAVPILSAKHTHEELRDTPIVDKSCCVLMANNEILLDLIEAGELERATARRRLAASGRPRRTASRRSTPAASRRGSGARTPSELNEPVPGYRYVTPAADHRWPGRHRRSARLAAPAAPALQQPRRPRQCHHDAGDDEAPGGQPRSHRPPAISRVRRRRLDDDALRVGPHRRGVQCAQEPHHRRRRRAVRQHGDDHRRRPLAAPALQAHRAQVGQSRRGERDRLRHRPLCLQGEEPRQCHSVGRRPGVAPADRRPVARLPHDRPSQRGCILALSGDHPAADGRDVPQGADREARAKAL